MKWTAFPDVEAMFYAAAAHVSAQAALLTETGEFHIALAGGNTPRGLYRRLAQRQDIRWSRWHVWFGDERCVPPDAPQSNYRMARETLLDHVAVPPDHIHPMYPDPSLTPAQAAERYEQRLRALAPQVADRPRLDLILLGLGPDGHTASLFPDTPILEERERNVAAVFVPKLDAWRISLTLPAIENARHVLFLVDGKDKAAILERLRRGPAPGEPPLPVERLHPRAEAAWFVASPPAQIPLG